MTSFQYTVVLISSIKYIASVAIFGIIVSCSGIKNTEKSNMSKRIELSSHATTLVLTADSKENNFYEYEGECGIRQISNDELVSIVLANLGLDRVDAHHDVVIRQAGCDYLVGIIPKEGIGGGIVFRISRERVIIRKSVTH